MSSDDEYADESFSDESYLDDFEDSPPKTFRVGSQPTEKVVSDLSALDDLMASLDNTLEKAKEQGGPSTSGSSSAKKEVTSSKKGGDEDAVTLKGGMKYKQATSNVRSMSDLDDLMSHLSTFEDPDQSAPPDVIAANQAAKMSDKLLSLGGKGPRKEERDAAGPKLAKVVEMAVASPKLKDEGQKEAGTKFEDHKSAPVRTFNAVRSPAIVKVGESPKSSPAAPKTSRAPVRFVVPPPPLSETDKASADGVIMSLLLNDLALGEDGKPVTMGRVRAIEPDSQSPGRVETATAEEVMMEQHVIPNLNYRTNGVPLEFQDELPEGVPMPMRRVERRTERAGRRAARGGVGVRGSSRSPVRSTARSPARSPARIPTKSPTRSKKSGGGGQRRVVSPVQQTFVPSAYKHAFQTEYVAFLGRLREASEGGGGQATTREENRMEGAIAECIREMMTDGEVRDTIMKGAYKKIRRRYNGA